MMNKKCNLKIGVALMLSTALSCANVSAQTCTVPPTCESLGYDKSESECSDAIKTLHCPLDKTKVFCLTAEEVVAAVGSSGGNPGTKVAEIGDIVYTDTISANPIPGRVPVGIVYDISGKMVSIAEYHDGDHGTACSSHVADGVNDWKNATQEDMGSIKTHLDIINATIAKISSETPKIGNASSSDYYKYCYRVSDGYGAVCMNPSVALSTKNNSSAGCQACEGYYSHEMGRRCVRKFGPNGANDVASTPAPTPVTTYAVGDAYKDSEGNVIGTVVAISNGGKSGTIAFAEGSGTSGDAGVKCSQKTTGGKAWTLASGAHACTLLKTAGSYENCGYSYGRMTCGIHSANGQGACNNGNKCFDTDTGYRTSCAVSDSLTYVCTTTF